MKKAFVKIDKDIDQWKWFHDSNTFRLWIYLLSKANWKDSKFENIVVKRGQFVTSLDSLSERLKLTKDQVRTSIKKLLSTGEITKSVPGKFTLINIENYCLYQDNNSEQSHSNPTQIPLKSHSNPTQIPTIEDIKDIKERKNNINPLTPLEDSEQNSNSEISGVQKQVSWEVNDIINALDDKSLELAKTNAPNWDVYYLAGVYVDGINSGIREKPRSIKAAFPRWCKLYTKGTPPT